MKKYIFIISILILTIFLLVSIIIPEVWKVSSISGTVRDTEGNVVPNATIRIKTTKSFIQTDQKGYFYLDRFKSEYNIRVAAWKHGYYVTGAEARPWDTTIEFTLESYATNDNPGYNWMLPEVQDRSAINHWIIQRGLSLAHHKPFKRLFQTIGKRFRLGCIDCHGDLMHERWATSAHALSVKNKRFLSMYYGTDVHGNQSPPTRYFFSRDYGRFPLPPDPTKPYYGPGYKLDFPHTAGNCAACHAPSPAIDRPYQVDPAQTSGVDAMGTHCDFCHKIAEVKLNPETGLPYDNRPGVLSMTFIRPDSGHQIFFGPYDDVEEVDEATYLPLQRESAVCAPCHQANFWDEPIYESYAEWLASPYPKEGKTCQSCHMAPDSVTTNIAPGRGGLERDPLTIATHACPGASDTTLLQNAVSMIVNAEKQDNRIVVRVDITNDLTGHHVPTDCPLRQMILLVKATDQQGRPLDFINGPKVPDWGGLGDPDEGYYAGHPGKSYAKILKDSWTGEMPTGSYWKPTRIVSDNRIGAHETDSSIYIFSANHNTEVTVDVTLLFRRAFIDLMKQKDWDTPDIVMEHTSLTVRN